MAQFVDFIKGVFGREFPLTEVRSTVDGKTYKVRDLPDKQEAADLMAKLRRRLDRLCSILEAKYPDKIQVKRISANFRADPGRFLESTPDAEHTSYSVNKGEKIHLCLRQRETGNESLVNENVMTFVAIHELAHTATETIGHGPDFWNNFAWLLREAESNGIYEHTDFKAHPVKYCGVSITDQPTYNPDRDDDTLAKKEGTDFSIGSLFK
jgi:hypothetical protein